MNIAANRSPRVAVVGQGRLGQALATALGHAGLVVEGPLGHGPHRLDCEAVLLCVPDAAIAAAATDVSDGPLVGHCSGAFGVDVLAPREAFALHPLMTVTATTMAEAFSGASCAVAGSSQRAFDFATDLAQRLEMEPFVIEDASRGAYHASASIASNFLITLEAVAERLAAEADVPRQALVPLVRASVENWAALGAEQALTGPVARGDEATITRQRAAVADRLPEFLPLFDEMVRATRALTAQARTPA